MIENAQWIGGLIASAIFTVWGYITTRKNRKLENALIAADAKLKNLEVDAGHMDLNQKANDAVEKAVDRILKIKSTEISVLEESYKSQLIVLERDLVTLKVKLAEAESLKAEAGYLADGYKTLIGRLRTYNSYLKSVLDENGIKYNQEDEL